MITKAQKYEVYLKKLTKPNLNELVSNYNKLADIYNIDKLSVNKSTKANIINTFLEHKETYIKNIIMSLDYDDFKLLKKILTTKYSEELINDNHELIEYLTSVKLLFIDKKIPEDLYDILIKLLNDSNVKKQVLASDYLYKLVDGIIIAYGVVSKDKLKDIINKENLIEKLEFYYKKTYIIDDKKLVSNKLNSKKRINSYYKNNNYKIFKLKDYEALGKHEYHHNLKSYKRLVSMLRTNYVFKKKDITFLDKELVIPYLYISLNEEELANKELERKINELFEFKTDKLKSKMIKEIEVIRGEFPLWEYRGFSKKEK